MMHKYWDFIRGHKYRRTFLWKKISTSHLFNENNPREDRDKKIETFYNNEIMRRGPQS